MILTLVSRKIPEYDLNEFKDLAEAAKYEIIDVITQKSDFANPKTFFGRGKVEEIKERIESILENLKSNNISKKVEKRQEEDLVILINNRVGSNQLLNLAELFHVKVIDRDLLILEIFELNAQTRESQLQIKLARLNLEVTRKEKEISQKVKYEHQGKDFKGKGYSTVDAYRHAYKEQRKKITDELAVIRKNRAVQRKSRKGEFNVAIVGYTGSGKTTFLNAIKETEFKTKSTLFTTVTTVSKRLEYKGDSIIFTDTVGFVYDIPHQIIEAFLSTLEETTFSDCLLILTDISEPIEKIQQKIQTTFVILAKIGALQIPIIYIFNKIDKIDLVEFTVKKNLIREILPLKSLIFYISALHNENLSELLDTLFMIKNRKIIVKVDDNFSENILNLHNKKIDIL